MADAVQAVVILLSPAHWVPSELRFHDDIAKPAPEDYCVCILHGQSLPSAFPCGQVDSVDFAIAEGHAGAEMREKRMESAVRVAAVRQTFSDCGILLSSPTPPSVLRDATRDILCRDGPRAFLDCLIAWDGGNPNPNITLCPLEEISVVANPAGSGGTRYFMVEVPDSEELSWASPAKGHGTTMLWAKPSEALSMVQEGRLDTSVADVQILQELRDHLPKLSVLSKFLSARSTRPGGSVLQPVRTAAAPVEVIELSQLGSGPRRQTARRARL